MRKKLSAVIIIIGVLIVLYPFFKYCYIVYWQHRLINYWEDKAVLLDTGMDRLLESNPNKNKEATQKFKQNREKFQVCTIDSIDLRQPILSGLNKINLSGIAYLEENSGIR